MTPRLVLLLCSALVSCTAPPALKDFSSDGCSLFPDGNMRDSKLWCECCYQHDLAYWQGGTQPDRRHADEQLRSCVTAKTGDAALAQTMFVGVRSGGAPVFPTWYRWGYGWSFGRGYAPLNTAEQALVDEKLARIPTTRHPFSCEATQPRGVR